MSTSRAFKSMIGPGYRLFLDQLVPQSARGAKSPPGKLLPSRRSSNGVCLSCRYSFALNPNRQLRFSSSNSTPPKPPADGKGAANGNNATEQRDPPSPSPPSSFSPLFSEPEPQPESPPQPRSQLEPEPEPTAAQSEPKHDQLPPNPDLPSAQNSRRSKLNRTLSTFMDRAQTTLFAASQRINDLTGYSGIETLKTQISGIESALAAAQATLHAARSSYKTAVASRSATQREVTTLLARQKTWTPADFERFTALYRQDYELEAAVATRADELEDAEREAERLGRELSAGILSRYHEEQIWSDKIRRMSTWGTWGLMGVNVLLFLVFQFGAEPWRRHRLVRGFEEKVREALEDDWKRREEKEQSIRDENDELWFQFMKEVEAKSAAAVDALPATAVEAEQTSPASDVAAAPAPAPAAWPPRIVPEDNPLSRISWQEAFSGPEYWYWLADRCKAVYADLSSDRKVAISMRDVSLIALEGVAAGAAISSAIAILFLRGA
ncbi:Mdm33 family-domain-containing protein [Hypoxylon sp. FL1150]|nr:Mdm33 family-domain-containing protein [Hypoxylon sp. FL1150]